MSSDKLFIKVNNRRVKIKGGFETIATYSKGQDTYDVRVDETDNLIELTIFPEKYLDKKLIIPIGKRDTNGCPIYQVLELKEHYSLRKKK